MEKENKPEIILPIRKKFNIIKTILSVGIGAVILFLSYFNIDMNIKYDEMKNKKEVVLTIEKRSKIVLSDKVKIDGLPELPVVEFVDSGKFEEMAEDLNFGLGSVYPIDTPDIFAQSVMGKCIDLDGKYGSQCVDLANYFWKEYSGRWISTCGTGQARGIWYCSDYNAGTDFELIINLNDIKKGDWVVFDTGYYGHIGMAMGSPVDGYVTLLGQNQGGETCPIDGSAINEINMSLKTFMGAFRPKIYITLPISPDTGIPK